MMIFKRDQKPSNVTEEEWEEIKVQADEWGQLFVHAHPETKYDTETMCWDFSANQELVDMFHAKGYAENTLYTPFFAHLRKDDEEG